MRLVRLGGLKYNGSSLVTNSFTISKSMKFLYSAKYQLYRVKESLHCCLRCLDHWIESSGLCHMHQ
jgi:hypothetical protein